MWDNCLGFVTHCLPALPASKKTSRPQQDGMFLFEGCYASIFMMFATRIPQGVPMT